MEQRDFFISYTNADEAWAVWIANVLKSNGYTAYVQALDIGPGDNFLEKMEEFIENSANFIAVWSKAYSESLYCMTEFRAAFHEWKEKRMKCLLPVMVDEHPMKRLYSPLVRVDLSDMSAASEKKFADAVRYAVPHPVAPTMTNHPVPSSVAPQETPPQEDAQTLAVTTIPSISPQEDAGDLYKQGENYDYGKNGVTQDYDKARNYYAQAAVKGHVGALRRLGYLYENGVGVTRDYIKARVYYEQAAEKKDKIALFHLGWFYQYGEGTAVDYAKALNYYQKAADAGHQEALSKMKKLRAKMRL